MNNGLVSFDFLEEKPDKSFLRERQTQLVKIIEAIEAVNKTSEWQILNELIWKDGLQTLEKRLSNEALKKELDNPEIYRLQGQIAWAKRYSDLNKLVEAYKVELNNITKKLNENAAV